MTPCPRCVGDNLLDRDVEFSLRVGALAIGTLDLGDRGPDGLDERDVLADRQRFLGGTHTANSDLTRRACAMNRHFRHGVSLVHGDSGRPG